MPIIFHQGALGDWILTFPLLRRLPPVTVVTSWSKGQLAAAMYDHVEPLDIERRDFSHLHAPAGDALVGEPIRERLARADAIISFVSDGQDAWADNVRRLARSGRCFFVSPRPADDWPGHVCHWHERQLLEQGFELGGERHAPARTLSPDGPVVIHPGSGGEGKCWPTDRYEALIAALRAAGRPVRVLLGEVELDRWPEAVLDHWRQCYQAEVLTSPEQLRQALAGASGYIGNDSGPTHLAAQMGLPTVALFGPTAPQRWAPQGPAVTILAPPKPAPMTWLEPSVVLAACVPAR